MKLSLITINYNNKEGLQKTFNSVFNQTWDNYEYIVIDGGSTDGSKELIEQNKDKITYWISEPDSGVYHAMNKGIKVAKGEYVLFLNSGDYLFTDTILQEVIPLLKSTIDIYYGDIYFKDDDRTYLHAYPDVLNFSYFLDYSLGHPSAFIKRDLFDNYFYYNENFKIVSDWEFFIYAICKRNASYKHLNIPISVFINDGISTQPENIRIINIEKQESLKKYFPLFLNDYAYFQEKNNLLAAQEELLNTKRIKQIFKIKNHKIAWKLMKLYLNFLLIFFPNKYK